MRERKTSGFWLPITFSPISLYFIHLKEQLVPGVWFEGRVEELHFFRNLETAVKPILILPQQIDMLRPWKA